ncbi:MAG: AAA family ATPase [Clostridia bacterium]|nr:AAA family ATPase [Clostridia bacterium]
MQYLDRFELASADDEDGYVLSFPHKLEMSCYSGNVYPFKIFPQKGLKSLDFAPITLFYGGNGSGKSTLLNVIAEKLELSRTSPANLTPYYKDYLDFCRYDLTFGKHVPTESAIITSDDVFDFLLDVRALNEGVDRRREELFDEYDRINSYRETHGESFRMRSLEDYEELKRHNEGRSRSKNQYTKRRLPQNLSGKSNGESAFAYFTSRIREDALYLLDEPENSLSAKLQIELAKFIEDSVRFYRCQFIISSHSPFLLSLKGARVYDLDASPACEREWTELENIRTYHDFFERHREEF